MKLSLQTEAFIVELQKRALPPLISVIFVTSTLLFGCAAKELTKEEKDQIEREVRLYNSEVISPIIFLSFATCADYKRNGKWSAPSSSLGSSSPFTLFEANTKGDNQFVTFRLKSSSLLWSMNLKSVDLNGAPQCNSTLQASHDTNSYIFQYNTTVPFSKIDAKTWKNASFEEFSQSTLEVTAKLYPFLRLAEKSRPQRSPDEMEKFASFLNAALLNIAVCAILDIKPNQCQMSAPSTHSDIGAEKAKIEEGMEQMQEKMKQRLRDKLEETEDSAI